MRGGKIFTVELCESFDELQDVDVSKHNNASNESHVLGMGVSVGTGTGGGGGSAATVWKKQQSMSAGDKNIYSRTM